MGEPDAAVPRDPVAYLVFTEFVPLGPTRTRFCYTRRCLCGRGTLSDTSSVHALARLMLAGSINHIRGFMGEAGPRGLATGALLSPPPHYGGNFFPGEYLAAGWSEFWAVRFGGGVPGNAFSNWAVRLPSVIRFTRSTHNPVPDAAVGTRSLRGQNGYFNWRGYLVGSVFSACGCALANSG